MERKKQKTSRPYVKKPFDRKKEYFYAIGIADPGTGMQDGYYFSMLNLKEICQSSSMIGIQVWLEHGDASREVIGTVVYTWLDSKCGLMVVLRFDASSLRSKVILEWIKNKLFAGISLGYVSDVTYENGVIRVVKKTVHELSIVRTPHHKSCMIQFVGNSIPLATETAKRGKLMATHQKNRTCSELDVFFDVISQG